MPNQPQGPEPMVVFHQPKPNKVKPLGKTPKSTDNFPIEAILHTLAETFPDHPMNDVTTQDPYKVLVGCIISLRTKDDVTIPACERLFKVADTPEKMVKLTPEELQKLIYPAGFYRNKSQTILTISQQLLDNYDGVVPNTVEALLKFNGVGRKTANLVVGLGHGLPAICVDIHVHRITNRLGYVTTKTPDETEMVLREKLPLPLWPIINWVLVRHGQEICKPIGARCDTCPVEKYCEKRDVKARKNK